MRVRQINACLDEVRRNMRSEAENIASALATELEVARDSEAALQEELSTLEDQALEQSRAEMRTGRLEREAEASRRIYETFLNRLQEAREHANLQTPDASFLTRATIPPTADVRSRILMIAAGALGGAAFGVGLVFLLEVLNNSFRDPDDLEAATGRPVLAAVPSAGRRRSPRKLVDFVVKKPSSALAEAVRNLRTSIFFSRLDHPPKTVMFASSLPGEGKTCTALLMALLMAVTSLQMDRSAVIVDCDLRRQTLSKLFSDRSSGKGLISYLEGTATLEEAIHVDASSGIHVLASETGGRLPGNPADILASERFQGLIGQLKARYDLVIFDTPPALVVTDARILAQAVDSVVYLVQWNQTARGAVLHGLRELASVEANIAGVALSLVDEARATNHAGAEYLSKRRYRNYVSS